MQSGDLARNQQIAIVNNNNPPQESVGSHNKRLLMNYWRHSKQTVFWTLVIWGVFIVQIIFSFEYATIGFDSIAQIDPRALIRLGANVPLLVKMGQYYRLFTATVLHAGLFHIFMNTTSMLFLCASVESISTNWLYGAVYVIGGIQGNMLSNAYHVHLGNNMIVGIGASTSICSVMGLYFAFLWVSGKKTGNIQAAKKQIGGMALYLLLISLIPGVSFLGHFGGLFSGAFIGLTWLCWDDKQLQRWKKIGLICTISYTLALIVLIL